MASDNHSHITYACTHTHPRTHREWVRERERGWERERIVQQFLSNQIFLVQPGWQTLGPTGGRNVGFVLVRNFESFLDLKGGRMDRMANEISRTKYQQPRTRFFREKKRNLLFFSLPCAKSFWFEVAGGGGGRGVVGVGGGGGSGSGGAGEQKVPEQLFRLCKLG